METEFGYQSSASRRQGAPAAHFEEMKPELGPKLKKQQATRKFAESADASPTASTSRPTASSRSRQAQAGSAHGAERDAAAAPGAKGPWPARSFSPGGQSDAIEKKRNTEAMAVGPSQVSGRVVNYTPARTLAVRQVKEQCASVFVASRAPNWQRPRAWPSWPPGRRIPRVPNSPATTLSREEAQKRPPGVVEAALRADPAALRPSSVSTRRARLCQSQGQQGHPARASLRKQPRRSWRSTQGPGARGEPGLLQHSQGPVQDRQSRRQAQARTDAAAAR